MDTPVTPVGVTWTDRGSKAHVAVDKDVAARIEANLDLVKHVVFQVAVHFPRHVEREELARLVRAKGGDHERDYVRRMHGQERLSLARVFVCRRTFAGSLTLRNPAP